MALCNLERTNVNSMIKTSIRAALASFFWWNSWERYWKYEECIEQAASSCIAADGANLTSGGLIWMLPAFYFSLRVVISVCGYLLRRRKA
ncbi:hypothetical protein [Variovorax paradoxus]|uniref:hypothetical protein n=1 Tax=Variovorax paradoxus TaxID=34073 RepID=UPI003D661284